MDNAMPRARMVSVVLIACGCAVVIGGVWYARRTVGEGEQTSVAASAGSAVSKPTDTAAGDSVTGNASRGAESESIGAHVGSADYPVKLDALRKRMPDNRYWALGAPTSDPVVAKARAARAERDNAALGRIQANDATPGEIRAYYTERRAISRDYLQLSQTVLDEQGAALSSRDRGMFELSANMHRDRLKQIDRDEADALARRGAAGSGAAGSDAPAPPSH
jgi:hypothetical protein